MPGNPKRISLRLSSRGTVKKKKSNQSEVSGQDSASGAQTSTAPLRNFQAPDVPEIGVQNFGGNLTQPSTFGDITQAADQRLAEQEAVQARVRQQMPYLQEDLTQGLIPSPVAPDARQEYVQDTLILQMEERERQVQDFNRNLQNIRDQNRAAGYFTDQDRIKFREQAIERINKDMATQHKNASFLTRNIINPSADLLSTGPIRALANMGAGLIGLPEMANDILATAMSGIIEMAGGPEDAVPTWNETYGNTPLDQISDYIREATQRQRDLLEEKYGEGGTWEQVKKGNINGAIGHIANGVGETVPIMAMYALTGGLGAGTQTAAGTALFGSQTYQELQDSDVAPELKLANSLVGGLAEGFFEQVGTGWLFNTARKVLRTAGKEQAESFLKDSIEKTLKRAYEKYYVMTAPAGEILTEGATLVTQNFMDQITGVDPERGLLDGWQDTTILATAASAPVSTPTAAIRSIRDRKARREAEGLLEYNNGIIEALQSPDVTVEEKAALFERYQNNTQKINQYIEQEQEWRGSLTDRQRAMVEEVEQRQSEIETLMQNESLPDAARAGLEQEQKDLDSQMDGLVKETQRTVDSSNFSPETQDRIRDMTARIDEINSEIRRMRNEGTLTPDVEAPLVLERRRIQDEINELEPDAQTETTVETPTDETITETVEETPTEPVEATDTATEEVVETPVEEPARSGQTNLQGQPTTDPSQAVQVSDEANPQRAAQTLQDSYNRLTEGMTPEQIDSDPDLVRMRDRIGQLSGTQENVTPAEQTDIDTTVEPAAETTTKQVQEAVPPTEALTDDLNPKIYERPDMEYPVYRVVVGGQERFIQRVEDMSGRPYWRETVKRDGTWGRLNESTATYMMDTIGDTKKEAVDWLKSQYQQTQENVTPAADPTEIAVAYAPLRERNVTSISEDSSVRDSADYKTFQTLVQDAAKSIGIPISNSRDTWGGYVDSETGRPVQEVSNVMTVRATPEQARLLAAIIGQNAPEMQDSVLVGSYSSDGQGSEYVIGTGSFENAQNIIPLLKENGIDYFTIDKNTGDIIILDTDGSISGNIDSFINKLKENGQLTGFTAQHTDAEFIGQNDYGRIIEEARGNAGQQNWGDLDAAIERAKRGYADKSNRPVKSGSPQLGESRRDRAGRSETGQTKKLEGAPTVEGATGPDPILNEVARKYAESIGIDLNRQTEYVVVDVDRAKRIAKAYEEMEHNPSDPAVKEAYENLIRQTKAQYDALSEAGYVFYFYDETNDPYNGNPWEAMRDLRGNKKMAVFATEAGYGSSATDIDVSDNPLLQDTGIEWGYGAPNGPKKRVTAKL